MNKKYIIRYDFKHGPKEEVYENHSKAVVRLFELAFNEEKSITFQIEEN